MALPFMKLARGKGDTLVSVDLGCHTTKALEVSRSGERFIISRCAMLPAPQYDKGISADLLGPHLKHLCQVLDTRTKTLTLALDVNSALVRHADLPLIPLNDMREVLKNSSKTYLQQDLPGHVFDCCFSTQPGIHKNGESREPQSAPQGPQKMKALVAGARRQVVEEVQKSLRMAGLTAESVVPGLLGPVNAFEHAMPEISAAESVALVDIGFRSTSICLLQNGELVLSRVVAIGGDRLTQGLAEALSISYAEAEGIKVGIPAEVQSCLEPLITPLGRELRASIDCFEHQQDKVVTQVFISGATAQSEFIVRTLQTELMLECKTWNPLASAELAARHEHAAELQSAMPQMTVAFGAAVAAF